MEFDLKNILIALVFTVGCIIIALISPGNTIKGIRFLVKSGLEYYLLSPFSKEDLEERLKSAIREKGWIETLYKKHKDIETLIEFTHFITSTLDPQKALYLVVKKLSEISMLRDVL